MKNDYLIKLFLFLISLIMLSNCSSYKVTCNELPFYITDSFNAFNIDNINFAFNSDNSKIVVIYNKPNTLNRSQYYIVYDLIDKVKLYDNAFIEGNLEWYSNNELILKNYSRLEPNANRIINIVTGNIISEN